MRVQLQPAFILHQRPYRETSLLLELFTQEYGRITAVARGIRTAKSRTRAILQPFNHLLISYQGRSELMTLISVEHHGPSARLLAEGLLSGLYINEILTRLLHKHDPYPQLYTIYQHTLLELSQGATRLRALRLFEKKLLEEIGYGVHLPSSFEPDKHYRFHPHHGFEMCTETYAELPMSIFSGKSLLSFANEKLEDEDSLREAKKLMRLVLRPLLGPAPLRSRDLFRRKILLEDNENAT